MPIEINYKNKLILKKDPLGIRLEYVKTKRQLFSLIYDWDQNH